MTWRIPINQKNRESPTFSGPAATRPRVTFWKLKARLLQIELQVQCTFCWPGLTDEDDHDQLIVVSSIGALLIRDRKRPPRLVYSVLRENVSDRSSELALWVKITHCQSTRNLLHTISLRTVLGWQSPRRLMFVDTFLKYSAGCWAAIVASLLPSWITGTSHFHDYQAEVYEVTVHPVYL